MLCDKSPGQRGDKWNLNTLESFLAEDGKLLLAKGLSSVLATRPTCAHFQNALRVGVKHRRVRRNAVRGSDVIARSFAPQIGESLSQRDPDLRRIRVRIPMSSKAPVFTRGTTTRRGPARPRPL